jgi:hypothetical protein
MQQQAVSILIYCNIPLITYFYVAWFGHVEVRSCPFHGHLLKDFTY